MSSAYVREVGRVEDVHGRILTIGVDHDGITIGGHTVDVTKLSLLEWLLIEAGRQAAANAEQMAEAAT